METAIVSKTPPSAVEVMVRVGCESSVKYLLPVGATVADIVDRFGLPDDIDLVVVNSDVGAARPVHSCLSRIREGLKLHFTKKIPIGVRGYGGRVRHFQLPVYGMLLCHLPTTVSGLSKMILTDTVFVDKQPVTAEEKRTTRVTDDNQIECLA